MAVATSHLYNGLADMVVVVGMDESTGLVPADPQPPTLFHHDNKLHCTAFEPQILAAISANIAMFPSQEPRRDENYPPVIGRQASKSKASSVYKTWAARNTRVRAPLDMGSSLSTERTARGCQKSIQKYGSLKRSVSRRESCRTLNYMTEQSSRDDVISLRPMKLPLGADALNSLVTLCFPDGAFVPEKPSASVQYLVLTNIMGERSYATCLCTHIQHSVEKNPAGQGWKCNLVEKHRSSSSTEQTDPPTLVDIPMCLVVISRHPYFTVLKDCLSRLAEKVRCQANNWNHLLKEFSLQLTLAPSPPPGNVGMQFTLLQEITITIPPPDHFGFPVVDFDVSLPFRHLDLPQILVVMTTILSQQRVVFLSSHYSLLGLMCQAFLSLIYPFKWNVTLVPLLSWNLIELVEAPGSFMMGCHSRHKPYLEKTEGLVLVDLDLREVVVCPSLRLPLMPQAASRILGLALQHCRRSLDWHQCSSPTSFSYEDQRVSETRRRLQLNKVIQTACLELMANLFRDVFANCNPEKRFFHKEQFMLCVETRDQPFYETILQTDMFNDFLSSHWSNDASYWSEFLEKTKPFHRNSLIASPSSKTTVSFLIRRTQSLSVLSTHDTSSHDLETLDRCLALPNFVYGLSHAYLDNCLQEVGRLMKEADCAEVRAACLYVQAMLMSGAGRKPAALETFHALETCSARLFPVSFVSEILQSLTAEEKRQVSEMLPLQQSGLYRQALEYGENFTTYDEPIIMELNKIPETDIDMKGFADLVQLLDLTSDHDIVHRLFDALTLGERAVVDPLTFEEFYKCWKENEMALHEANIPETLLDVNESLLKTSDMIKTSFGTGRIVLSQKRLLFLQSGSRRCREAVLLRNVKSVEEFTQRSLFSPGPALKIHFLDERVKPFSATLRDQTHLWYLLTAEMWAGKMLSEERKDPSLVHRAAQNALLINAFVLSGEAEFCYHHDYEQEEAEGLCYFLSLRREGATELSPEARETLQHQLDPNSQQAERVAVETLLYTPGRLGGSDGEDWGPVLWCGLTNGKIMAYDATTWLLQKVSIQANDKVVCLIAVGDRQVWAGSFDNKIYVINLLSKCCNQVLSDHTDVIIDFASGLRESVYSASLNGQILRWDTRSLKVIKEVQLNCRPALKALAFHNDRLWCLTREELLVVTTEGIIMNRVSYHSGLLGNNRMSLGNSVFYSPSPLGNRVSPLGNRMSPLGGRSSTMTHGGHGNPNQLDCFLITPQNEVWLGLGRQGVIVVYYADSLEPKQVLNVTCRGVSKMTLVNDKVWVGSKDGVLYVFSALLCALERKLRAHSDGVRALCSAQDRYVLSGAGSRDGRIAIWKTS